MNIENYQAKKQSGDADFISVKLISSPSHFTFKLSETKVDTQEDKFYANKGWGRHNEPVDLECQISEIQSVIYSNGFINVN